MLFTRSDVKVYIFVMVPPKKFNVKPIFFKTDFIFTIPLKQADLGKKNPGIAGIWSEMSAVRFTSVQP